ncbi:signal peptidase I [Rathayibacter sp. ZW T2_19]|uniref:Signal peptidase I n=1 Tax=Rathayibacter rubneri TaxID=2950106 RepID=A0A9X2IRT7_9MICO|nr:signal peptidase I [Rathayibacter rubneri]MCM6762655.1 signal peptidase I [Rathayibacter rubneri]
MTLTDTPAAAAPAAATAAPRSPRRLRTALVWTASVLLVGLVALGLLFQASGGRWFIVQTPSMGTFAPVGTLVLTTPTAIEDVRVGDVVSFHPSTTPDETYTHRVVEIAPEGTLVTQGDINGAVDPWATGQEQLIGVVTTSLPGVGWLAKALPLLLAGAVLVQLLTRLLPSPTHRAAMRILGLSLVASITVFLLRPFVGLVVLEATVSNGVTDAVLVSTGLLPIRVSAEGAAPADLVSGEVGRLKVPANDQDWYSVSSALHLPVWGWIVFALLCALPLIYTFAIGLPAATEHTGEHGRRAAAKEAAR